MNTPALDCLEARKLATGTTPAAPAMSFMQHVKADPIGSINAGAGIAGVAAPLVQGMFSGGDSAPKRRKGQDGIAPMPAN